MMQAKKHYQWRPGMTLVELVVVLAIVAIVITLTLSAIQKIRETARRMQCASNLRQIGTAMHLFHDTYGFFPTNGGYIGAGPARPRIASVRYGVPIWWGVGHPNLSPDRQTGSWAYSILPYLEQQAAYQGRVYEAAVPVYLCPSRGRTNPQPVPSVDPVFKWHTYVNGGINPWGKTDYAGNIRITSARIRQGTRFGPMMSMRSVTDGTANTILIGEKSMDPRLYYTGGWLWDEPILAGGGAGGTVRSGATVQRDQRGIWYANNWGAPHSAGAQFLWVDGSVRLIRHGTPRKVMMPLLTPAGGEVVRSF